MKKKITTLVLITTMTMTMLAACGNTKDTNTNTPTPTIEASSEVAESKEESVAESTNESVETSESKGEESTFVYSERVMAVFPKFDGQTYQFIRLNDEETNDCVTLFSTNGTTNCTNAFYWVGPITMNFDACVYDDNTTLFNKENTSIIEYYWDTTPSEATLGESDDADYDLMISNGQFKFHFPSDYDQEKAWETFNSFKVLTIDEASAIVEEFESKSQALNGTTLDEIKQQFNLK